MGKCLLMSPPLVRRFAARAAEIGPARRAVAAYAREYAVGDPDAVALAVSEAVTNVVLHAYVDEPAPGEVEVVARGLDDGGLVVTVSDDGRGMMPHPEGPGAGLRAAACRRRRPAPRRARAQRGRHAAVHGLRGDGLGAVRAKASAIRL